jgi:hypothetical protein
VSVLSTLAQQLSSIPFADIDSGLTVTGERDSSLATPIILESRPAVSAGDVGATTVTGFFE